jgi:hypothetical protein
MTVNTIGCEEALPLVDETVSQEGLAAKATLSGVPSFVVICRL